MRSGMAIWKKKYLQSDNDEWINLHSKNYKWKNLQYVDDDTCQHHDISPQVKFKKKFITFNG